MNEEEFLKKIIRTTEERYIWYKKEIENLYKNKETYEPGDWRIEFGIWFKDHLREMKNYEESRLKELRIDIEYYRAGMNPPYMYNYNYKRKTA